MRENPPKLYGSPVPSLLARRGFDVIVVALAVLAQVDVWTDPVQSPKALTVPAALLWTLPLLLRGRFPLGAPAVVFVTLGVESFLAGQVVTNSQVNPFALLGAFWVAGTHANARKGLAAGAVGCLSLATIILNEVPRSESAVPIFLLGAGAWAIGHTLTERGRRAAELEERASRLERENENAVLAERARIASELHDVIAHSVSVMTIQAGAARMLLDEDPSRARAPLVAVEETGHQALGEMRRLLGILRDSDDGAALAPQPGVAQLDALVEQVRAAGLPVELTFEGEERPLPPGVDLVAYRVVQEALTNVLKHAGPARARVRVGYGSGTLELEVANTGRVSPNGQGGHGLVGMRQRVALYGGELEARPRDGGYVVRARLPLEGTKA